MRSCGRRSSEAGAHRDKRGRAHAHPISRDEDQNFAGQALSGLPADWGIGPLFDIVNGFLIDAVAHGTRSFGFGWGRGAMRHLQMCNLAEINRPRRRLQASSMGARQGAVYASGNRLCVPGLSLMVWILKREVRAFGGCLGMYRRRRTWHAAISVGEL